MNEQDVVGVHYTVGTEEAPQERKPQPICPLLAVGRTYAYWQENMDAYRCLGAGCAWWVVDGCVLVALAHNTAA